MRVWYEGVKSGCNVINDVCIDPHSAKKHEEKQTDSYLLQWRLQPAKIMTDQSQDHHKEMQNHQKETPNHNTETHNNYKNMQNYHKETKSHQLTCLYICRQTY